MFVTLVARLVGQAAEEILSNLAGLLPHPLLCGCQNALLHPLGFLLSLGNLLGQPRGLAVNLLHDGGAGSCLAGTLRLVCRALQPVGLGSQFLGAAGFRPPGGVLDLLLGGSG